MKFGIISAALLFILGMAFNLAHAQSTPIVIGGEGTELAGEGVLTGNGASQSGGLGAAVLENFTLYYQPLAEGDWVNNVFPDPELYSLQIDIPDGLPDYQSWGRSGDRWDSRGRNGEGILPWIREGDQYYDHRYLPTGEEPVFGVVESEVQWTLNYWSSVDDQVVFVHTCMAGTVEDYQYDVESGDAVALLVLLNTVYLGYGEDGEPGPGFVEYEGGTYQGFDLNHEASGLYSHPAFFFEYDGETDTGTLTPCSNKVRVTMEGWTQGYYATIQEAIDASQDGDCVWISPGLYIENIDFDGKAISVIGNPENLLECTIHGNGNPVVTFSNGEDENSELSGFLICHGGSEGNGGGIICSNSSPTITNCMIGNNEAQVRGGGISCEPDASPVIRNCTIVTNVAGSGGGGIWCGEGSSPVISNCTIQENEAVWNGGGINMYIDCSPVISNCNIESNLAGNNGGGIIISLGCNPVIDNCAIRANSANETGGGITIERDARPVIKNCRIYNNSSDETGGGISVIQQAKPVFRYCLIYLNSTQNNGHAVSCLENAAPAFVNCTITASWPEWEHDMGSIYCSASQVTLVNTIFFHNCHAGVYFDEFSGPSVAILRCTDIEGGVYTHDNGEVFDEGGNIFIDPQFVDWDDRDYNLLENSLCIDAGTDFFVWDDDTLVNCSPEDYHGYAPDMGALESEFSDIDDLGDVALPLSLRLLQNYPNPFNRQTRIGFMLPNSANVQLTILDINGRLVETLVDQTYSAGLYHVEWRGKANPAGTYILKLEANGNIRTGLMLYLK